MKCLLALLMLLVTATAAAAQGRTACRSEPDVSIPPPWAWRTIDGRKCWYPGERMRDKSLLYWAASATPAASAESAAPDSVTLATTGTTEPAPPTSALEPEPEPQPAPLSEEDQRLLESYWPDLPALMAERSPTYKEMFDTRPPPKQAGSYDPIVILFLATAGVIALIWGLERYSKKRGRHDVVDLHSTNATAEPGQFSSDLQVASAGLTHSNEHPLPSFLLRGPAQHDDNDPVFRSSHPGMTH